MVLKLLINIELDTTSDDYGRYLQMALKLEPDNAFHLYMKGVRICFRMIVMMLSYISIS